MSLALPMSTAREAALAFGATLLALAPVLYLNRAGLVEACRWLGAL